MYKYGTPWYCGNFYDIHVVKVG